MTLLTLTREEAATRSALVTVDRYDIDVDLTGLLEGHLFTSTSTITFSCPSPGAATFVDCAADITRATLNGAELDITTAEGGRLPLHDLAAHNVLVVEASTRNTGKGEGILRTVDPTDGLVYVWTSLEPDEARRLWACFDQPDLKAPHHFVVTAPDTWLVTSNGAPESVVETEAGRVWTFPDTPRLSTYVVVVNAGPFHEVRQQHDGYDLGFFCRQSLVPHLERDLEELVTLTRQGLAFFGEKFGMPFPQERYDQVFVPNLGGAMENWGCVTYGDSQLFRTPPTHNQRDVRAEFIHHEMAHMWFGDLVTMRWWDDLWLNEAFASWASNWSLARATEFDEQWGSFLALFKRTAYEMDMGPGRHPIRGDVPDVASAMANFDAITYIKGQSVLQQLMAYIGEDAFVEGLRSYFRDHAWGNTVLDDLMSAFGAAAGRDLGEWTTAWLDRAGTDVISLEGSTLVAESPDDQDPRPHRLDVASYDASGDRLRPTGTMSVEMTAPRVELDLPEGDLRLLNAGDLTFAAVRPDPTSLRLMLERVAELPDATSRALVIGTCTQLLLLGELAPRDAARATTRALAAERSPALIEPFLLMGAAFAGRWASAAESPALVAELADVTLALSKLPEHRQPALRTLAVTASTDAHWAALEEAVEAATDTDLAWRMAARRAELDQHDPEAVQALLESDPDPDAHTKRLRVLAAHPHVESKEEVWKAFFVDYSVPASRETLELGAMFWRPQQAELLAPFALRYLDELRSLQGGLLNQGVVIRAMYPLGAGNAEFLARAQEAASDERISAYARNQLHANNFVLSRILEARQR
ncbi:aminopeptidase N [Nocardioides gansuensis]|nr:aminopeptidase N [Nocardioides gansuensis]